MLGQIIPFFISSPLTSSSPNRTWPSSPQVGWARVLSRMTSSPGDHLGIAHLQSRWLFPPFPLLFVFFKPHTLPFWGKYFHCSQMWTPDQCSRTIGPIVLLVLKSNIDEKKIYYASIKNILPLSSSSLFGLLWTQLTIFSFRPSAQCPFGSRSHSSRDSPRPPLFSYSHLGIA